MFLVTVDCNVRFDVAACYHVYAVLFVCLVPECISFPPPLPCSSVSASLQVVVMVLYHIVVSIIAARSFDPDAVARTWT